MNYKLKRILGNAWQHGLLGLAVGALFAIFYCEPKGVLMVVGMIMLGIEANQYRSRTEPYNKEKWLHSAVDFLAGMLGGVVSLIFCVLMKV